MVEYTDTVSSAEAPSSAATGLISPQDEDLTSPANVPPVYASTGISEYIPSTRHHDCGPDALNYANNASLSEPSLASASIHSLTAGEGITSNYGDATQTCYPPRIVPASEYSLPSSAGYVQAPTNKFGPINGTATGRPIGQSANSHHSIINNSKHCVRPPNDSF